jgi:exopolyphosphatase/pppGpp-phosphohydrolase
VEVAGVARRLWLYIIANAEIEGFDQRELRLMANIAPYPRLRRGRAPVAGAARDNSNRLTRTWVDNTTTPILSKRQHDEPS